MVQCFASKQDTVTTISKETEPLPPSSSINIMSARRYDLIDLTSRISANTEGINNKIINTHNEIDAARTALNTLQAKLIKTEMAQCFASDQNTVTTISTETREQDTVTTISTEMEPCDRSMQTPSIKDVITKIKEYCKDTELLMSVSSNNHQSPEPGKPGP
jgi:DNA-binding FrmR family transcriptional regulator